MACTAWCNLLNHIGVLMTNRRMLPLLLSVATTALAVFPMPLIFAQPTAPETEQNSPRQSRWDNLSPEQQAQIKQIKQSSRAQIDAILTPEQRSQVEAARSRGEKPKQFMTTLNLTETQKAQIQAIRQQSRQQIQAIVQSGQS
jgi:periplasmic protein CpxP/Spy